MSPDFFAPLYCGIADNSELSGGTTDIPVGMFFVLLLCLLDKIVLYYY
jgi:hypothetical protein